MPDIEMRSLTGGRLPARRSPSRDDAHVQPFQIGVYPVTEAQLAELLGHPGSHPQRPAVQVSWFRAIRFCNAASEWEGLDHAYAYDGEHVTWHRDADGYRLPTENEWEFACRAGSTGPHYGPLQDVAWTSADGLISAQNVGGKHPNLHGVFDMLGNVREWCWDLNDPEDESRGRVLRGGSFLDNAWNTSASARRGEAARSAHLDVGFRLARSLGEPSR